MTKSELIAALENAPDDALILSSSEYGPQLAVLDVEVNDDGVVLKTEDPPTDSDDPTSPE